MEETKETQNPRAEPIKILTKGANTMKIVKTVKGKVLVGATAVALFAGTGVAFGASDAGTRLGNWFEVQLGLSTDQALTDVNGYIEEQKPGLVNAYNEKKEAGGEKITNLGETSTETINSKIDKTTKEHTEAITKKKAELTSYATKEFNDLLDQEKTRLHNLTNQVAATAQADINEFTGEKGREALEELENKIGEKSAQAKVELETAINNAKSDLDNLLNEKETSTVEELKKVVDNHIADLRIWTTNMINFAVQEQTDLIEAKAKELETAAMEDLQEIVEGI